MGLIKNFIIALACGASIFNAAADDNKGDNTTVPGLTIIILKPKKELPKRPNMPSRIFIECEYGDGYMQLTLPQGMDSVQVDITDGDFEWTDLVTVDNPVMLLPVLSGEYDITCTAPDGRAFYGQLYF